MDSTVYGTSTDMWTQRAIDILDKRHIAHAFVDLDEAPGERERLIRETSRYQTPYVVLRGRFIGGYAELDELERLGQLEAGAPPVEIARREQEFVPVATMAERRRATDE